MNSKKRGIIFIISFCALFILVGALHVCLYGVDFADETGFESRTKLAIEAAKSGIVLNDL